MRPRCWMFSQCFLALVLSSTCLLGQSRAPQSRITQAVEDSKLTVLRGNTHPLALPQYDQGAAPADLPMNRMLLVLQRSPEQEAALKQLLDDQQDKASPNYHKWLTPDEFGLQFGPADQDIQTITAWLQLRGFQVAQVSKGRTVIEFSGTAAQVQEAFHTEIDKYVVNGEQHWANASDPQIPAALAPVVGGVYTLHNFLKEPQLKISKDEITARVTPGAAPQFTSGTQHALAPADFYTIYNFNPLGASGPKIAIVGRSNINLQDIGYFHYWTYDQAASPNVIVNGPDPGDLGGGEEEEAVLDTTWVGAVAPSAWVALVVSASTNTTDGVDLSELYIIDNNLADVMSESFGGCEASSTSAEATAVANLAAQAAAEGITYVVSAGDSGAAGCDDPTASLATHPPSVNVLASTPYTVAVGGTMFQENGHDSNYWKSTPDRVTLESAISYIPEDVWNESCTGAQCATPGLWAGGGGASIFFQKPSWQSGVAGIPAANARYLPDVALTAAAHDPYLLCLRGSCVPDSQGFIHFAAVSGTSVSAPAFAGIMALAGQKTGARLGQPNYVLYRLAAMENLAQCNASNTSTLPSSSCVFNDVTVGNNAVPGETAYGTPAAQYQSTAGYDPATGLGSVNVTNLLNAWSTITFNPTTTNAAISPTTAIHGSPINLNVHVVSNSGTGTPSGPVWLQGGPSYGNLTGDNTVSVFPLDANGAVSTTTHLLPGGEYQVSVHYAGDGTYAPSDSSPPVSVFIQAEPSTTTLSILSTGQGGNLVPFATGPYGSPMYLKAHVGGQSGFGAPTAYVNFWDNGSSAVASPYVNSNGDAVSQRLSQFAAGAHSVIAGYYGDFSFSSSTSSPASFTITQAATTTSVSSQPATQGVTLVASVNAAGYGNPPTGMVTFSSGGALLGSATVSGANIQNGMAQATATFPATQLPSGQSTITATYSGDVNYVASTSAPTMVNQQADFALSPNPSTVGIAVPGASANVVLTVAAFDAFSGTINFSPASCSGLPQESACSFSPASVSGSGTTRLTVTTTGPHPLAVKGTMSSRSFRGNWIGVGVLLPGILLIGGIAKRRSWAPLLGFLVVTLLLAMPGCGGGGSTGGGGGGTDPGTPAGTYMITVTAASGSLTHTTSFQFTVQ